MRRAVLGGVLTVLLAACTATAGGVPAPTTGPAGIDLPPRPRDVSVVGVDPCALLTETQRAELGLEQPPVFDTARSPLFEGPEPACSTRGNEPRAVYARVALPYDGLGIAAFALQRVRSAVTPLQVLGFPAVQAVPRSPNYCTVAVDAAPGQAVNIQFGDGGRLPPIPQDELCRSAIDVAEAALSTLLTMR